MTHLDGVDAMAPPSRRWRPQPATIGISLLAGVELSPDSSIPVGTGQTVSEIRYRGVLNASADGVVGRVRIESIGVDLPIYHGTDPATLERGAGHLEGSHLPVGGESTRAVITAHRGLATSTLFTHLDRVDIGDRFQIIVLGEVLTYEVIETKVIDPSDSDSLLAEPGRDLVTLVDRRTRGSADRRRRLPHLGRLRRCQASSPVCLRCVLGRRTRDRFAPRGALPDVVTLLSSPRTVIHSAWRPATPSLSQGRASGRFSPAGLLDHARLELDAAEAGHVRVDVMITHAVGDEANPGHLGAHLHRAAARTLDLEVLDHRHGVPVLEHVAHGVADHAGGLRALARVCAPLVAAHGAHEERSVLIGVRLGALGARGQVSHGSSIRRQRFSPDPRACMGSPPNPPSRRLSAHAGGSPSSTACRCAWHGPSLGGTRVESQRPRQRVQMPGARRISTLRAALGGKPPPRPERGVA